MERTAHNTLNGQRYRVLILAGIAFMLCAPVRSQPPQTLIQTDYELYRALHARGTRDGLIGFLDADAIQYHYVSKTFRNDAYVTTKDQSNKRIVDVRRRVEFAMVSAADDYGFTTGSLIETFSADNQYKLPFYRRFIFGFNMGPWAAQWTPSGAPHTVYDDKLLLWRRDSKNGAWRVLTSMINTDHDRPGSFAPALPEDAVPVRLPPPLTPLSVLDAQTAILAADAAFSALAGHDGLRAAYDRYAADGMRLMRDGYPVLVGRTAASNLPAGVGVGRQWLPAGATVSASGDLGCSYGLIYSADDTAHAEPLSRYAHIWYRDGDNWRLLVAFSTTP